MIRWLERRDRGAFLALCAGDAVTGARMHTLLAVYGLSGRHTQQWLAAGEDGAPAAALLRFDGRMLIAGKPPNPAELAEFLGAVGGFGALECSPALCRRLPSGLRGQRLEARVLCHGGPVPAPDAPVEASPPLREVFDLLAGTPELEAAGWQDWYPHTAYLVRHGLGFAAGVRVGGALVSAGGVYACGPRHGVIGGLYTAPDCRGRGFAAAVVRHLCGRLLERGLTPVLLCGDKGLVAYYRGLGFSGMGRWCEIRLPGGKRHRRRRHAGFF